MKKLLISTTTLILILFNNANALTFNCRSIKNTIWDLDDTINLLLKIDLKKASIIFKNENGETESGVYAGPYTGKRDFRYRPRSSSRKGFIKFKSLFHEDGCGLYLLINKKALNKKGYNTTVFFEEVDSCGYLVHPYKRETGKEISSHIGIGIILGTGVGGGIVVDGKIFQGRNGGAGEVGHSIFKTGGHPCYCGRDGCVEQYLSGPAIEASFVSRMYSQIEKLPTTKEVFELARNLDPIAIAVVSRYQKDLRKFLLNLTNIFDPDYFVLGLSLIHI